MLQLLLLLLLLLLLGTVAVVITLRRCLHTQSADECWATSTWHCTVATLLMLRLLLLCCNLNSCEAGLSHKPVYRTGGYRPLHAVVHLRDSRAQTPARCYS